MIGKQQTNYTSKSLAPSYSSFALEATLLFLFGALAMFLHAKFRWGYQVPGHHGIEFMALLMAGRSLSRVKLSSVFMALGIGTMIILPFMGFKNPISALGYIFPVLVLDFLYSSISMKWRKSWFFALLAGLAYASVPLYRIILMVTLGFPYSAAIKYGSPLAPIAGFFVFGTIGAAFTIGVLKAVNKNKRKK